MKTIQKLIFITSMSCAFVAITISNNRLTTLEQHFGDNGSCTQFVEASGSNGNIGQAHEAEYTFSFWEKVSLKLATYYFMCKEFFSDKVKPLFKNMLKKRRKLAQIACENVKSRK